MDYGIEYVCAVCVGEAEPQAIADLWAKVGDAQDATLAGAIPGNLAGVVSSATPANLRLIFSKDRFIDRGPS